MFKRPLLLFYQLLAVCNFAWCRVLYFRSFSSKGLSAIRLGSEFHIYGSGEIEFRGRVIMQPRSRLASRGRLEVGGNFTLNSYSRVIAFDHISIGDNVTIAQFVSVLDHDHRGVIRDTGGSRELTFDGYDCAGISIGSNVWIADKVTILKGVHIGSNVIIGANSVVTSDIPDFCVAAGVPAKVIKKL
jgi:acetyltransferase-like isoleucine patch superfamily enzyme